MNNSFTECNIKMGIEHNKKIVIFVYCSPKVGSTTLVTSLRLSILEKADIVHIHDELCLEVLTGIKNIKINDIIKYNSSIGKDVYVIDIYRSPIERKMSVYFDKITSYHFNKNISDMNNYEMKRIIKRFNNIFMYIGEVDNYMDYYNIEQKPFIPEQKYLLQEYNGIKYIKLRLKDIDKWSDILYDIFKMKIFIITDYEKDKSELGKLYKRFKKEYKIPQNYLEYIECSSTFIKYNSIQERNEYIQKWKNKTSNVYTGYNKTEYELYNQITLENQYYNDIEYDHYKDNGCKCNICFKKRCYYRNLLERQIPTNIKISHNNMFNEPIKSSKNNRFNMW